MRKRSEQLLRIGLMCELYIARRTVKHDSKIMFCAIFMHVPCWTVLFVKFFLDKSSYVLCEWRIIGVNRKEKGAIIELVKQLISILKSCIILKIVANIHISMLS